MLLSHRGNAPDNATLIGFTNLRHARTTRPMVIEKGRGIFLIDENGREYMEGTSSFYSAALGFSDQDLVEAAVRQMRQLPAYASGPLSNCSGGTGFGREACVDGAVRQCARRICVHWL